MRIDRLLSLVLLLGLFALPAAPTTGPTMCLMQKAQRAPGCCETACSRAPVSFGLGLAFDHGRRSAARDAVASPRSAALLPFPSEFRPVPLAPVQALPIRPFSLLSTWRI